MAGQCKGLRLGDLEIFVTLLNKHSLATHLANTEFRSSAANRGPGGHDAWGVCVLLLQDLL